MKTKSAEGSGTKVSPAGQPLTIGLDRSGVPLTWEHHLAVWLWIGWIFWYLLLLLVFPPIIYAAAVHDVAWARSTCYYTGLILFVFAILPCDRKCQPQWCLNIGDFIALRATEYFNMQVLIEDEDSLKKSSPAFFVLEPHDVLPLSIIAFSDALGAVKGHRSTGCITSMCFQVPFMRHFYSWAQAVPATREVINDLLASGRSPLICPGGVQEAALITSKNEVNVYLKKRKGFVKIAISHGAPVVPVFCFGLRNAYDFWLVKSDLLKWFGRKIGFMPMIFFGFGGIPYGPAKPCTFVNIVGKPIPTTKKAYKDITEEDVDEIHALYLAALEELYHKHKADYGYEQTQLNIY